MNTQIRTFWAPLMTVLLAAASAWANDRVVCESHKDKREFCSVYRAYDADIWLARRLSDASCIEGISWGRNDRGIWVDDGCRGEFAVRRGYRGGYDRRGDDYDDYDYRREQERREEERREHELEQERRRNDELRQQLEREKREQESSYRREQCPQGFEPGNHRCSDAERKKGCKDMKLRDGTTCNSRGWGNR